MYPKLGRFLKNTKFRIVMSTDYFRYLLDVEDTTKNAVVGCIDRAWDENHITFTILKELTSKVRTFSQGSGLLSGGFPFGISFDAYKASGKTETDFGDIAVMVRFTFPGARKLEGVGLLEAKRAYLDSGRFDAIKFGQLRSHGGNASSSRVLLYDCEPWNAVFPVLERSGFFWPSHFGSFLGCHATCVPTMQVLASENRTRWLHGISVPFSYQLVSRYFNGFDLEYSSVIVNQVKNGARVGLSRNIDYIIVADVSFTEEHNPDPATIEVNEGAYENLKTYARKLERRDGGESGRQDETRDIDDQAYGAQ